MALLIAAFVFGAIQVASLLRIEIKIIPPGYKPVELKLLPTIISDQPKQKLFLPMINLSIRNYRNGGKT